MYWPVFRGVCVPVPHREDRFLGSARLLVLSSRATRGICFLLASWSLVAALCSAWVLGFPPLLPFLFCHPEQREGSAFLLPPGRRSLIPQARLLVLSSRATRGICFLLASWPLVADNSLTQCSHANRIAPHRAQASPRSGRSAAAAPPLPHAWPQT